jgi:hypothetical protein
MIYLIYFLKIAVHTIALRFINKIFITYDNDILILRKNIDKYHNTVVVFMLEKMVLQHFQYIGKSTVIWQSVSKFPFCFRYIQHIFLFILGIYWSFSVFFQKYVIKCFTRLNTISVFFLQIVLCWTQSQTEAFYYFEWGAKYTERPINP